MFSQVLNVKAIDTEKEIQGPDGEPVTKYADANPEDTIALSAYMGVLSFLAFATKAEFDALPMQEDKLGQAYAHVVVTAPRGPQTSESYNPDSGAKQIRGIIPGYVGFKPLKQDRKGAWHLMN